jgi:hypothetical protein
MAREDLKQLLIRLFGDPALHEQVREKGWEGLGLSDDEVKLLSQRDCDQIRAYLGADSAKIVCVGYAIPEKKQTP